MPGWLGVWLIVASVANAEELELPYEQYELENGLDVILAPDRSTPIVYVNLWYHVGSRDEEPGLTGFAHLFEHLMFQGSLSWPGEYFEPLQEVGAVINGSTNPDRTNYYEKLPSHELPLALWLESDRMATLLDVLDQDKLDEQRGVVRNERRQRYENPPYGEVRQYLAQATWPDGHPYQHLTIGSHEDLEAASVEDVKAFFQKWYVPNNASLVIAGDFDEAKARELVDQYFGDIPRGAEITRPEIPPATLSESKEIRKVADVPEQRMWISWISPAFYAPGDAELDLLASVLSSGKDSRLQRVLVKEKQIAKSVSAYQVSSLLGSQFIVQAVPSQGHDTDEVLAEIDAILAEVLGDRPPTDEEVDAARAGFEASFYGSIATIAGKGELLQRYNMYMGSPGYINEDVARYISATPATVTQVGKETLSSPRVVLHMLPEPAPEE